MVVANAFVFTLEGIFIRAENTQQNAVINLIKFDTFHAVVEVNKKSVKSLKQLMALQHLILLTQKMILV